MAGNPLRGSMVDQDAAAPGPGFPQEATGQADRDCLRRLWRRSSAGVLRRLEGKGVVSSHKPVGRACASVHVRGMLVLPRGCHAYMEVILLEVQHSSLTDRNLLTLRRWHAALQHLRRAAREDT